MRKRIVVLVLVLVFGFAAQACALVVTAKSVSSGTYEDGDYTPGAAGNFEGEYIVDEAGGEVILDRIVTNNREGRLEEGAEYDITNIVMSEGLSSLLVARNKKGQKIFTAVREDDLSAVEVLILGEDFYEFCRAANGKFYLEYGEVTVRSR